MPTVSIVVPAHNSGAVPPGGGTGVAQLRGSPTREISAGIESCSRCSKIFSRNP